MSSEAMGEEDQTQTFSAKIQHPYSHQQTTGMSQPTDFKHKGLIQSNNADSQFILINNLFKKNAGIYKIHCDVDNEFIKKKEISLLKFLTSLLRVLESFFIISNG